MFCIGGIIMTTRDKIYAILEKIEEPKYEIIKAIFI